MKTGNKRAILGVCFAAMLIGPAVYVRVGQTHTSPGEVSAEQGRELIDRYGLWFSEAAEASGITFRHTLPRVDPQLAHIEPQIASMGASVSIVDFDRDGWQDVYVTSSGPGALNRLYHNRQDGTFADVAAALGVADLNRPGSGACMGTVWADYDNDGYEDLFVYKWGRPELFHNDRGSGFTRVTEQSGLPEWINAGTATWLDYDLDGLVDLFVAGYWPDDVRLESLADTRIMPESFEYADNGGRKWLWRNAGNGRFVDVTHDVGLDSTRWTLAVVSADFNRDGAPDLFLANDYGVSELYLNTQRDGVHTFREVGKQSGIGHAPKSGMNAAVGDVLNQGALAIYETNISEQGVLIQGNNLWVPEFGAAVNPAALDAADATPRFENLASVMGVELGGWSFGAQFGDLNNDGRLDLYLTNGYVSGEPGTTYWYDFSEITGGHSRIISDARNWPAMQGRSLSGHQHKRVWLNDGAGGFTEIGQVVGISDRFDGRAVALADLQNRGVLDVLVANQGGPLLLYRNHNSPQSHWIDFELEGSVSNRSAIGTQITVFWNGQQQLQELVAASGYTAQNQRRLHFGLGPHEDVERVVIHWPSGREQVVEAPAADTVHQIREAP